jgi:deazaflavin-dependent oxidoreductase (nitroreductase family)
MTDSRRPYDWGQLNPEVVAEFRRNGGRVARFGDSPMVILHVIGARTGKVRETPLIVVLDEQEMLLFGTNAGSSEAPAWAANLRAHPRITVELGTETFTADVLPLPKAERRARVRLQAERIPAFAAYVDSAAPREIPVFTIRRV